MISVDFQQGRALVHAVTDAAIIRVEPCVDDLEGRTGNDRRGDLVGAVAGVARRQVVLQAKRDFGLDKQRRRQAGGHFRWRRENPRVEKRADKRRLARLEQKADFIAAGRLAELAGGFVADGIGVGRIRRPAIVRQPAQAHAGTPRLGQQRRRLRNLVVIHCGLSPFASNIR